MAWQMVTAWCRLDKETFNRTFEINRSNPFTPIAERFTSAQYQPPPGGILRPLSSTEPIKVEEALKAKDPLLPDFTITQKY